MAGEGGHTRILTPFIDASSLTGPWTLKMQTALLNQCPVWLARPPLSTGRKGRLLPRFHKEVFVAVPAEKSKV